MKIISVVGARPNFIKIAPFIREINSYNDKIKTSDSNTKINHILVHTGQHYDSRMSGDFFELLSIPEPDINMEVGSGTHAEQIAGTMIEFEKVLQKENPDWVIVVGDVNATLACSVIAKKEHINVCHIEAGIRSGDNKMPEEINRLVTDRISDLLLTPDRLSVTNLENEGIMPDKIKFVGNIMIDSLDYHLSEAKKLNIEDILLRSSMSPFIKESISSKPISVVTLHRPSNVDNSVKLEELVRFFIDDVSKKYIVIWPIHPRTLSRIKNSGLYEEIIESGKIILLQPVNYLEMIHLTNRASLIFTDSGGLQEESSVLGTPCITLRNTTERPSTLAENGGTSVLCGSDIRLIRKCFNNGMLRSVPFRPELWDGKTAQRCLFEILNS